MSAPRAAKRSWGKAPSLGRTAGALPVTRVALAVMVAAALNLLLWFRLRPETAPVSPPAAPPTPAAVANPTPEPPPPHPPLPSIAAFQTAVAARLAAHRPHVRPARLVQLRAQALELDDPSGRTVLRVATLTAVVDARALARGEILVDSLTLYEPVLTLERPASGAEWNLTRALARLIAPPPSGQGAPPAPRTPPADRRVVLRDVAVVNGQIAVRSPGLDLRFEAVQAAIPRVAAGEPGAPAVVELAELSAVTIAPPELPRGPVTVQTGRFAFPDGRLDFQVDRIAFNTSLLLDAQGDWLFEAPGLGLEAQVRAAPLRLADIRFLLPSLPPEGAASFLLQVARAPAGRSALAVSEIVATSAEPPSELRGSLSLVAGGGQPPELVSVDLLLEPLALAFLEPITGPLRYGGSITGRVAGPAGDVAVHLVAHLTTPELPYPFEIGLTGDVAFLRAGLEIRHLAIDLRAVPLLALRPLVPWLPLHGVLSGQVLLRGPPARAPLELDLHLVLAEGVLDVAGTLDLTGAEPAYDFTGRITGVQIQALIEPPVPPVSVSAAFTLTGRGTSLATAQASLALDGRFSGWLAEPADTLAIRARLAAGVLTLDTATLSLATLRLDAGGVWGVTDSLSGALTYALSVGNLEAWGPYVPVLPPDHLAGSFRAEGVLAGTLPQARIEGTAEGERLEYRAWRVRSASVRYDLAFGLPVPAIAIQLAAEEVSAPEIGQFDTVEIHFERVVPAFLFEVHAGRTGGGAIALRSDGQVLPDGTHEVTLRALSIDTPSAERWELVAPASLRWGGPAGVLVVRRLAVQQAGAASRIAIDGQLPPANGVGLRVQLSAVPIGPILALTGIEPRFRGSVNAEAELRGTAASPVLRADFNIQNGVVDGLAYQRIEGTIRYADLRLVAHATAMVDGAGPLEVEAELSVELTASVLPGATLLRNEPLHVSVAAENLPLELFERMTPEIREAEGALSATVEITGTAAAPVLEGRIRLLNGAATFPSLEQRYDRINADLVLEGPVLRIDVLRVHSGGWASATGELVFEELTRPIADVDVDFDGFRAVGFSERRRNAGLYGTVHVGGPLLAPTIAGRVRVDNGDFSITPFMHRPAVDDELVMTGAALPEPVPDSTGHDSWMKAITVDSLVVVAGENLWIVTDELRVQLAGQITVYLEAGELRIIGTLEGDRGTFTLRAGPLIRRFTIVNASVRFLGNTPPDPIISVTASWIVYGAEGERREILAQVSGTFSAPSFALTTPEGSPIPESELLSFILFGQPSYELGEGVLPGAAALEEIFVGGLTELASISLEEALLRDVGLPFYQFQIRPGTGGVPGLTAPSLVFGVEVAPNVYLTIESGLGALFGGTDAITNAWSVLLEWRIDPEWTLTVGYEPINRVRLIRAVGAALPIVTPERQFFVDIRRRWTY